MSAGLDADLSDDEVFVSLFPVHRACRDGDLEALVSLARHFSNMAHLTVEDSCCGWTPIHWAAHYGQLECVAHLVQMGCEVNLVTSRFNQTATHIAAFGGHPHCVVWLTQAGADVNRQDFVGEAPIHKAAQSGSLECIQILLRAGAKPHLRNASGQTAADLAHAHGFLDCFRLVSKTHLGGLDVDRVQSGNGALCGQDLLGRKRVLTAVHTGHKKKARTADDVWVQTQSRGGEAWESTNMESEELSSEPDDTNGSTNSHPHTTPGADSKPPRSPASPSSQPASQQSGAPGHHAFADMSPSWGVSYPAPCLGQMDSDDFLYYGHYHGFGDTAEELPHFSRQHDGAIRLYHSS